MVLSNAPYSQPYSSLGKEPLNNYYLEISQSSTAKSKYYYVGVPGLKLFAASSSSVIPSTAPCRLLYTTSNNRTYGVFGNNVVEISNTGAYILLGKINTSNGVVRACDNSYDILLVDGSFGYIINIVSNTLTQITDPNFPGALDSTQGPSHCCVVDTYFIVNSKNTNKYYWSAPGYVPTAFDSTKPTELSLWNGLYYGEKIGDSDNIVGLISIVNNIFVIGQYSLEVHYNTQDANQTFGRMQNAYINFGCSAPDSICRYSNSLYWVGSDHQGTIGIFTADSTFQPKRISTRGVESRIQSYSSITDCQSFAFAHNGHAYVCFQFAFGTPTDEQPQITGATWVYDITTSTWCRRTSWNNTTGLQSAWKVSAVTSNFNQLIAGDRLTNALYTIDGDYYVNDNANGVGYSIISRDFTSPNLYFSGKNIIIREIILQYQAGVGLINNDAVGVGADPQIGLSISYDAGRTWTNEVQRSLGTNGEYGHRCRWVSGGRGRNVQFRLRITDPVQVIITGIAINYEVCSA